MNDDVLGYLRMARLALLEEKDEGGNSRALSIALTHIDTAVLWWEQDLSTKAASTPSRHSAGRAPVDQN